MQHLHREKLSLQKSRVMQEFLTLTRTTDSGQISTALEHTSIIVLLRCRRMSSKSLARCAERSSHLAEALEDQHCYGS